MADAISPLYRGDTRTFRVTITDAATTGVEATLVRATETDSARSLAVTKYVDLVRATEADAARGVSAAQYADLIRAIETDARALSATQAIVAELVRTTETDSARDVFAQRSYGQRAFQVVLHEEETGGLQTVELGLTAVSFVRGYEAVAYAHGPEDIEYEVEVEAIAA